MKSDDWNHGIYDLIFHFLKARNFICLCYVIIFYDDFVYITHKEIAAFSI